MDDSREARAGIGKSLRVSTIGQTQKKWPLSMKFPVSGIEGGKTVVVKFSYVILGGGMNFAIIGGSERYGDVSFRQKGNARTGIAARRRSGGQKGLRFHNLRRRQRNRRGRH